MELNHCLALAGRKTHYAMHLTNYRSCQDCRSCRSDLALTDTDDIHNISQYKINIIQYKKFLLTHKISVSWQNRRHGQSLVAHGRVKRHQQNNDFTKNTFEWMDWWRDVDIQRHGIPDLWSNTTETTTSHKNHTTRSDDFLQEAQLPQRNSTSAAHVYVGWLTDRAMHRTPQNRRGCTISDIQTLWFKKCWPKTHFVMK